MNTNLVINIETKDNREYIINCKERDNTVLLTVDTNDAELSKLTHLIVVKHLLQIVIKHVDEQIENEVKRTDDELEMEKIE